MNPQNNKQTNTQETSLFSKNAIFFATFVSAFVYIVWRLLFTLPLHHGVISLIWGILLWVAEAITVLETFTHFNNVRCLKLPEMPDIPNYMYPDVDLLICTHNESAELLYKTLNGCRYLSYPDKSKVHVYLCDDQDRPEIKELTEQMGLHYFGFTGNIHAKAGNINYGLERTTSPLVAIFDADMIPTSDFLLETVPYFFAKQMIKENGKWRERTEEELAAVQGEKDLGYVQTQQSFYNPDPLQRNLYLEENVPNEQDYFYRSVNVARTHTGSAAFAGSNTLFLRQALEDAGGLATYSITEDLATSVEILSRGYTSMAVDKELAHGLSPEDADSFIKQRQRWSRGSSQVVPNAHFFKSKMPLRAKYNFFLSYLYWWSFPRRMIYLLSPVVYALFGIAVADVSLWNLLLIWVPYRLIYNYGMDKMTNGTISSLWSSIMDTIQFPYLIFPVIAGTLKIPEKKFWVTPKDKVQGRNSRLRLAAPHFVFLFLTIASTIICGYQLFVVRYEGAAIALYWLVSNIFALIYAILYYVGRVNARNAERINATIPVTLLPDVRKINGFTSNISEGGMSILLDTPEYLPADQAFELRIKHKRYKARMDTTVKQVQQIETQWQYGLMITEMEERDKSEYFQILYDRNHMFPHVVDISLFGNLRQIIKGIATHHKQKVRKLPRMHINTPVETEEFGTVDVLTFNYQYFSVKKQKDLPQTLTFLFENGFQVTCRQDDSVTATREKNIVLYELENWKDLAIDPVFHNIVMHMLSPTTVPLQKFRVSTRKL